MANRDKPVIVFGAGAHGRVLIEALELAGRRVEAFILDDDSGLQGKPIAGREVCTPDRLDRLDPASVELVNAVGSIGLPAARRRVYERFAQRGFRFAAVAHLSATVSSSATLAEGVQIMAGCVVQAGASIGVNTLLNTRVGVDHDCVIGGHCHLAPGVTLSGNVAVGDGCHLGTGAVVIQGVHIGPGSFVAAGAVVTRDLPPGSNARGVPAKPRD
ncbi:MAG: acetyltransferase [Phycisphaeraceae bacterium]